MVGTARLRSVRPAAEAAHAFYRFSLQKEAVSARPVELHSGLPAFFTGVWQQFEELLGSRGFHAGRISDIGTDDDRLSNCHVFTVAFMSIKSQGSPAHKTDQIINLLASVICEHCSGLTVDGNVTPLFMGKELSFNEAASEAASMDGVRIELVIDQFVLR